MAERPVRVYRLDVTWPPGTTPIPARRRYLTRRAAVHHADVLRDHGAIVTVTRSDPVTWPEPEEAP